MRMNSAIPLQVRQPDVMNALMQGTQAASTINEGQRVNALAQLYREQGAGIMRGDENALAALAQHSPQEALGIQDSRQVMDVRDLGMDQTRQNMQLAQREDGRADERLEMAREQGRQQARQAAAQMSAQEAAKAAAEIERAVAMGMAAQSPEQWDALMRQNGAEDMVGQFDQREAIAAGYLGAAEAFATFAQGGKFDPDRYRNVGDQLVDLNPGGGAAPAPVSLVAAGIPSRDFGAEDDLSKQWEGLPEVKNFASQATAFDRIREAASTDSGPGDIALIFNYMKLLDPGSVVREGEFATAENAGGAGEKVRNLYNRTVSGERLSDDMRGQFVNSAGQIYQGAEEQHAALRSQYEGRAGERGMPESVITEFNYRSPYAPVEAARPAGRPAQAAAPQEVAPPDDLPPVPSGIDPGEWATLWPLLSEQEKAAFR